MLTPAIEDDALDRRSDRGVAEVDRRLLEIGLGDEQRALVDGEPGLGRLEVSQGDVVVLAAITPLRRDWSFFALELPLAPGELGLRLHDVGLGSRDAAPGLVDAGLEERRVEPGQHGAFLHLRSVADRLARVARVGAEALDLAGDLGANVNHLLGLERSRGVDRGPEVTLLMVDRAVGGRAGAADRSRTRHRRHRRPRARPSTRSSFFIA